MTQLRPESEATPEAAEVAVAEAEAEAAAAAVAVAVRCTGLVKRYDDLTAVDGLDLAVRRGECFGLLGPNGAGKTTTVEVLEGLLTPDAGQVELLGQRWGVGKDQWLRERIGIQLQQTELADKLTVTETLQLFRSFYPRGRQLDEVITLLGLEAKRSVRVHKLSGGQKQRLAAACALIGDPELLFLDEPTTGLDPQARHRIWEVVETFRAGGGTVLLTTHYMEEAEQLCDHVAIVDHGRVIASAPPAALVESLEAEQILHLRVDGELSLPELEALPGLRLISHDGEVHRFGVAAIGEALPALLTELTRQGAPLLSLTTHQPSLEDVFIQLTGRSLRDE